MHGGCRSSWRRPRRRGRDRDFGMISVRSVVMGSALALTVASPVSGTSGLHPSPHMLPSRAKVQRAVLGCGLSAKMASVQFEPGMDEDVVWVARGIRPTSKQINCLARTSVETTYEIYFHDSGLQKIYDPVYRNLSNASEVASARNWLREHHRLAALPLPRKNRPLSTYAQAVEQFCGIKPGKLLVAVDAHFITFAKGALGEITANGIEHPAADGARFECVMNTMSAADLQAHGIGLGFAANGTRTNR